MERKSMRWKNRWWFFWAVCVAACSIVTGCSFTQKEDKGGTVTQERAPGLYPAEPAEMRDIAAQELVDEMKLGWNLGDTLDVCEADRDGDGKVNEHIEAPWV